MSKRLIEYINSKNIAEKLDDTLLNRIGSDVIIETDIDLASRAEWEDKAKAGLAIARQVVEEKTFPWPGAANIKYPLIASAVLNFAARAYPDIVKDNEIAKSRILGPDPEGVKGERGQRVARHMSYQFLEEMEEWEPDTDQMLHILPAVGMCWRETYFDPSLGRNVSNLLTFENFIVNQNIRDLATSRRKTKKFYLYKNEVIEKIRAGLYSDIEKHLLDVDSDPQAPHWFYSQHRWLDLDEDGYEEPYIVTVHIDSGMVARITAGYDAKGVHIGDKDEVLRIEQIQYFTDYGFLPDPGGGYHKFGFGHLLLPLNEAVNTTVNQLLDAGTMSITQGGFVTRGFKMKGGTLSLAPNEWKIIDANGMELKNSILPLPTKEPSNVLFQLLGFIVEAGKQLASNADVLTGEGQPNTPATTTLALIEQGLKVYNSIYKRIFRSLKAEFKKVFRLNGIYLENEAYFNFNDSQEWIARDDYNMGDLAIAPVADPNSTDIQRLIRAQALMSVPGLNPKEQQIEYLRALKYSNEEIQRLTDVEPPPDPKQQEIEMKIQLEAQKLYIEKVKTELEMKVSESVSILNLAKAEAAELGPQLEYYKAQSQQLGEQIKQLMSGKEGEDGNKGAMAGVEPAPSYEGSPASIAGTTGGMGEQIDAGGNGGQDGTGDSVQTGDDGRADIPPDDGLSGVEV